MKEKEELNRLQNIIERYVKLKTRRFGKPKRKLESKNMTIQNQAEDIHFLIGQQNGYKETCIDLERKLMEEQNKHNFLIERDNKLQKIEQIFMKEPIDLEKLSKLVKRTK